MPDVPSGLTIDSGGDQFPVSGPAPRLSWKPAADAASLPEHWELEALVDGANVTRIVSDHRLLPWPWTPLASRQRVEWRVRAIDGGWSAWHRFEVGLLDADWQAEWISPVESALPAREHRPAHTLFIDFEVADAVTAARLYSTALGVYTASVNGARAGGVELAPGSTSYDRTLYAQAADVTDLLRVGRNRLEILLADGWYRGFVGAFRLPAGWGRMVGARVELHLELASGRCHVVRSGADWRSSSSAVSRADLMDGQTVDLTADIVDEGQAIVGAVQSPGIDWSPAPPVRVVESRPPVTVARLRDGVWTADFGQNASGWVRLTDLGPRGTRTVLEYGEFLGPDGDLSTSHLDSSRPGEPDVGFVQRDEVISAGVDGHVFEPRLTVHGFQYVRITRAGAGLDPASLTMCIVQTDLERTGGFACSAPDLNRLHEIADWSFRGNAVDVPTDCPTRERLAWTGDYQVFAPTATRLYDVLGFTRKWLRSVRDDQLADGRIANFSPDGRRIKLNLDDQFAGMTGSAGWGDAIVAVPWEMYVSYGDAEILAENWDAMRRWVDWALKTARETRHPSRVQRSAEPQPHEQYVWDGSFHWGEWCEPTQKDADGIPIDPIKTDPTAWFMADKGEVGTAFLFRSARTLSQVARALGRDEDATRYGDIADRVRRAWQNEFLTAPGRTAGDTQAAYVRALAFGLIPAAQRQAAVDRLVELIQDAGMHLGTGFLSTGDLLPALADSGRGDIAHALLRQRTPPSWLCMVDRGATTIWEDWDGIDEDGAAHESLNHYSKGTVARFLHSHVLGLRQEEGSVGWESFVVAPVPGPDLEWARGFHETPRGRIDVEWRIDGDALVLRVGVPAGCSARIEYPDGSAESVGRGGHVEVRRGFR